MSELKGDVSELQTGFRLLGKEVEHMVTNPNLHGASQFQDQFTDFLSDIGPAMTDLEQVA